MTEFKICSLCKISKPFSDFFKNKWHKDGYSHDCKICKTARNKQYYLKNKEKYLSVCKVYRQNNKDIISLKDKIRKTKPPKPFISDKEKRRIKKQKRLASPLQYFNYRFSKIMREYLRKREIRKNNQPWESLVSFNKQQLLEHLEKQFTDKINWDTKNDWHIDHILPVAMFNYDSYNHPHFKLCWSLVNIRPLLSLENLQKGNKIPTDNELEIWFSTDLPRLEELKKIKKEVLLL